MVTLHPTLQKVSLASYVAYQELIKTHLARLIEIDSGFDFDRINYIGQSTRSATVFGAVLTQEGICSINQLIVHIMKKNNIIKEGIFRMSGSKSRQIELQKLISTGKTIYIDPSRFSVHDCCGVLKLFVSKLPEPLLTEYLQDFFLQTLKLESSQKQLDSFRLLILLLPASNRCFLYDLLHLFEKVVEHSSQNLMVVDNISTVFAPHFFRWSTNTNNDLINAKKMLKSSESSIRCLSLMIKNVRLIFEPPEQLLTDATLYLENRLKFQQQNKATDLVSSTNLAAIPAAKFCATTNSSYSAKEYTEMQLAELYAQMQSMAAESPAMKKKFLKKFNQNKNGTPMVLKRDKQQQELIKQSLKKSSAKKKVSENRSTGNQLKSFGAAIKKRLLMTPNCEKKSLKTPSSTPTTTMAETSTTITRTPNDHRDSMSPRSIVPIDEGLISLDAKIETPKITKNSPKKSNITSSCSKIPVAVISPIQNSRESEKIIEDDSQTLKHKVQRIPTPIRSKSNSIISSTRLSRTNSSRYLLCTIPESIKENMNTNIPSMKSLPTNFYHTLVDETIRRKRVKYLASRYEQLIASSEQSKIPKCYKPLPSQKLNESTEDSEEYVSLTSIYTKKSFLERNHSFSDKKTVSSMMKRLEQQGHQGNFRGTASMRVTPNRYYRQNSEKHTIL